MLGLCAHILVLGFATMGFGFILFLLGLATIFCLIKIISLRLFLHFIPPANIMRITFLL